MFSCKTDNSQNFDCLMNLQYFGWHLRNLTAYRFAKDHLPSYHTVFKATSVIFEECLFMSFDAFPSSTKHCSLVLVQTFSVLVIMLITL